MKNTGHAGHTRHGKPVERADQRSPGLGGGGQGVTANGDGFIPGGGGVMKSFWN